MHIRTWVLVQGALLRIWDLQPSGTLNSREALPFSVLFGLSGDSARTVPCAQQRVPPIGLGGDPTIKKDGSRSRDGGD